jgi:hypothetical protein
MLEKHRPQRSRLISMIVMAACVAVSAAGCDWVVQVINQEIGLPSPDPDTQELKRRQRALDDLVQRTVEPHRQTSGEITLRLSVTGGWGLPEPGGLHMTIQGDGRVVRVTDTTVYSSTRDYTSLWLDQAGILRVLEMIEPLLPAGREDLDGGAGVSPSDRSAWLEVGDVFTLSMDRIGQSDGYTSEQLAWRARMVDLLEHLQDLAWLEEAIIEPEAPWVPPSMTVLATSLSFESHVPPETPVVRWPLGQSITDLATGDMHYAHGEKDLVLCLSGDKAPPVFALLTGVNHARLRVDDGQEWELDVRPHYPGYRLAGDPCL